MNKPFSYLVLSDIHLGHKRTKTKEIIRNLDNYFSMYGPSSSFTELDAIFIAGDLFDGLLDYLSGDIHDILLWLDRLLRFCGKHNIILRIMEGTPSHDWKQSMLSRTLHQLSGTHTNANFKYVDALSIEYISDFDMQVLYVPDEWNDTSEATYQEVLGQLSELHLDKVDIAIMHGMFSYQVPQVKSIQHKHIESNYLDIVKYFISIGHVHVFSTYERIVAQGSFDRLSHGEEHPKGGVMLYINPDLPHNNDFTFIENTKAKQYKTFKVIGNDLDKNLTRLDKLANSLPDNSYIRIACKKKHPMYIGFEEIKKKYIWLFLTKEALDEDVSETKQIVDSSIYVPVTITEENIVKLLLDRVAVKDYLTAQQLTDLTALLESHR